MQYRLSRTEYLLALKWNGIVWASGDAEVNPSYELYADAYLLTRGGTRS